MSHICAIRAFKDIFGPKLISVAHWNLGFFSGSPITEFLETTNFKSQYTLIFRIKKNYSLDLETYFLGDRKTNLSLYYACICISIYMWFLYIFTLRSITAMKYTCSKCPGPHHPESETRVCLNSHSDFCSLSLWCQDSLQTYPVHPGGICCVFLNRYCGVPSIIPPTPLSIFGDLWSKVLAGLLVLLAPGGCSSVFAQLPVLLHHWQTWLCPCGWPTLPVPT